MDRYYFESLYVRVGHILFELATDEPGFMGDEPYETLGENYHWLCFEDQRAMIEKRSSRLIPLAAITKEVKMMQPIQQIHHISAIVGDPQENVDFYREVLGLRLVKQTVNFDDPYTYHLYYSKSVH